MASYLQVIFMNFVNRFFSLEGLFLDTENGVNFCDESFHADFFEF